MTTELREANIRSKDYYRVLQLHPDAGSSLVDQAYWRLARQYNAAIPSDESATGKLDDLNEAYAVLATPSIRREYDRIRRGPFGDGNGPTRPAGPGQVVPAIALRRQLRQKQRRLNVANLRSLPWKVLVSIASVLMLASAALITGAHPAFVLSLFIVAFSLTAGPLLPRRRLKGLPGLLTSRKLARPANMGDAAIPGGRSRALRKLVYDIYAAFPHLGPAHISAVGRYTMLTQRFIRGERQLLHPADGNPDGAWLQLIAEQRELAVELRRQEAALGIAPAAPTSGGDERPPGHDSETPTY
jgi:hypothetical protein